MNRGVQKRAVAQAISRPMTPAQICRKASERAPLIQLRDTWFILQQMKARLVTYCITPRNPTWKLFFYTDFGRKAVRLAFGTNLLRADPKLDWQAYSQILCSRIRRLVLGELCRLVLFARHAPRTAEMIRKRLWKEHPMSITMVQRALRQLTKLRLIKVEAWTASRGAKIYSVSERGMRVWDELRRMEEGRV